VHKLPAVLHFLQLVCTLIKRLYKVLIGPSLSNQLCAFHKFGRNVVTELVKHDIAE
jgi:hypothetical protein